MKLYMHPVSTACRPVRLLIAENGVPCDEETVDILQGAHYQEPYASLNPNRMVPWLEDGDFHLTEGSCWPWLRYNLNLSALAIVKPKTLADGALIRPVMPLHHFVDHGYARPLRHYFEAATADKSRALADELSLVNS